MSFYLKLLLFTLVNAGGLFTFLQLGPERFTHPVGWAVLGFFVLVTALLHYILIRPGRTPQQFVRMFMLLTTLKLFLFMLILVTYIFLIDTNSALVFIIYFLVFYFSYTAFEVAALYKHFRTRR